VGLFPLVSFVSANATKTWFEIDLSFFSFQLLVLSPGLSKVAMAADKSMEVAADVINNFLTCA
jgi:hypothetical protein